MFALAVVLDAPPGDASTFREEAAANLCALCKVMPSELLPAIIEELARQVPQLAAEPHAAARVGTLLGSLPFDEWQLDESQARVGVGGRVRVRFGGRVGGRGTLLGALRFDTRDSHLRFVESQLDASQARVEVRVCVSGCVCACQGAC